MAYPERIVCLTAETTEIAFVLGAGDRVVGVSGFARRPEEARSRPKVAAFSTADVDAILELDPELVLAFSDMQAAIAAELVRRGATVLALNQRTLAETGHAIRLIGRAVGLPERGEAVAAHFAETIERTRERTARRPRRPRVYFEEWDDPTISGIAWVSELIETAGGEDIFPELRDRAAAPERIIDRDEVVRRDPELIVASWCGKRFEKERMLARPGWDAITAVRAGAVHELPSDDVLQPGPSLLRGLASLERMITAAVVGSDDTPQRAAPVPTTRAASALPVQACPRCAAPITDIKGSRLATCERCGYKDDCC